MLIKAECALDMEQRIRSFDAALITAQTMLSKEECALAMGHRSNNAALKDAQTMSSTEVYA